MILVVSGGLFDLDTRIKELDNINESINESNFWNRSDKDDILKNKSYLSNLIEPITSIKKKIESNLELLDNELDSDMLSILEEEYNDISLELEKLKINTYLSGKYDKNNCILEIHAGAGGTEACDWANMLYRMYQRYLSNNNYKVTELDKQDGEEVGIKSVTIKVEGINAYGYLKNEKGR